MGKATILEAQNSDTIVEQGNKSGVLGKLKGVFADYMHGTRNADRLYSEELWDNRVFGSEDVMEALETKTLFGELDHPEGDRCETLAQNAAISITKLEKRPDEGVIYGEAEILDTPTGRIVKALADSGAKLGVSSRGMGEEVYRDGQNIIDPDTYDFITFDVVVTPANTKARVELTESKHFSKLTESIKKEINESETENQLNQIRTVVENIQNNDELLTLIENKSKIFNVDKVPAKLTEANKSIALKLIKEKYEETKAQLNEALSASTQLSEENAKLTDKTEFLNQSRANLKAKLRDSKRTVEQLKKDNNDKANLIEQANKYAEEVKQKLNEAQNQIKELNSKVLMENNKQKELILKSRKVSNRKAENLSTQYKEEIIKLNEALALRDTKIEKLMEGNKLKQSKLVSHNRILAENKQLRDKLQQLEEAQKLSASKLTESKKLEETKVARLEARIKELEQNNLKLEEAQHRYSKLTFDPVGTMKAVAENFNHGEYSQEEIDLYNALTGNN